MASDLRLKEQLPRLTNRIVSAYQTAGSIDYLGHCALPNYEQIIGCVEDLKEILYPGYRRREGLHIGNVTYHVGDLVDGLHDKLRIECDVDAGRVTIYEARPPWQPDLGPEWIRSPVAQLRYTATRRAWILYWLDRNLRWRQYREVPAGRPVAELLDEIGRDPTGIFWG